MKTTPLSRSASRRGAAFTLVEIMVSLAVLTILLLISAQVIGQVQSTWSASNARVSQFKEARTAFDIMTRNISQATLNTYIDYNNNYLANPAGALAAAGAGPTQYLRKSELHFRCGPAATLITGADGSKNPGHAIFFQAPLGVSNDPSLVGLDRLLCARGYFIQFSSDEPWIPSFITGGQLKYRYRLMEYCPPAEQNSIYSSGGAPGLPPTDSWFANASTAVGATADGAIPTTRPVADNIVALIISPRREAVNNLEAEGATGPTQIATDYNYDSNEDTSSGPSQGTQYLLPPLVRLVLIAIDEKSAIRLEQLHGSEGSPPLGNQVNPILQQAHDLDGEDGELARIVKVLQGEKLNYRVFSATVLLRGAKWSI